MAIIFLNGLNAKAGGGKSILNNFLTLLKASPSPHQFLVLTPDAAAYKKYENERIKIVDIPRRYKNKGAFPIVYSLILPKLLAKLNIDLLFNLADIPVRTKIKQVFLFDWSYAVYPNSVAWGMMGYKDFIIRKTKLFYFKTYLKYIDEIIAQTDTMKKRLSELYHFKHISVVPNAVSLENMVGGEDKDFALPDGIKLLYLTHYYPHKNLEIFLPLAQEIKKRKANYKIITTIAAEQHSSAKKFLADITELDVADVIHNIGPVDMKHVPSLYQQSDGLLMPTLLESFSGTYVEAMFHKIPIFTSDLDFAEGVCKNGAEYFNPMDAHSILNTLENIYQNKNKKNTLLAKATHVLNQLPNWNQAFAMYNDILDKVLDNE